jgi:hypothetical protein
MLSETVTTDYLGETIRLMPTLEGWRAWWIHPVMGAFGDGVDYPTCEQALTAVENLIQRSGVIDCLLGAIDEWKSNQLINPEEHSQLEISLLGFIVS